MIIDMEERLCKAAEQFFAVLEKLEQAAERDEPIHEAEQSTWDGLREVGRQMIAGYIEKQGEKVARPEVIEHQGKKLRRLPQTRTRRYVSVFGPTPFERDVYATRETQRQEVIPLDAKLGMPEGDTSYLLQKWSGVACARQSYQEARETFLAILGFGQSVNGLEEMVERSARHADPYFAEQAPVDAKEEAPILVATSDCKGVPMRRDGDEPTPKRKRLGKGEKQGRKRMACVGGVYSVEPFHRTVDDILDEMLREKKQSKRPKPKNKRLRAVLTREIDGKPVNGKDVVFDWLADQVQQRTAHERRTIVAIMDGESKLRDLQEAKIPDAVGILDIWHVTEYLWKLAYCFHAEGSEEAESFVETYLRKILEGNVGRAIGGIRQMATKRGLSKHKREKLEQCLNYFEARRETMKYDEYLAAGYPIGSGVVEGACRHLVKDRMEQTGMRWRVQGAQAILSLRAIYLNDDWNTFHADRIQAEQRRLYPYKERLTTILNCAT
jgi:hypothetical protein